MKKFTILAVAVMLVAVLLAGCSGNNKEETKPSTGASASPSGSPQSSAESGPENFNPTGYPIVNEKITLKFFAPKSPIHGDYGNMKLFKKMEELTNIHIEWITPPIESYAEQKNLTFASGNMPDAYFLWNNRSDEAHGPEGLLVPLEELIDKYAVNYKKAMEAFPNLAKNTTSLDGHVYATGIVQDIPRDLTFKQWINKDWLDKLKLQMPKTIEAYYDVLKAFKTGDPNGNSKADEIPLTATNLGQTRNFVLSAYGYVSNGVELNKDNKVVYVPTEPAYKAYLEFMSKLYSEELLDRETFTLTSQQLSAKGNEGLLGSFDHCCAFLAVGEDKDSQYVAIPPLTSALNADPVWLKFDDVWTGGMAISKDNKYPEATIRWLDFLFSEEGKTLQAFGVEGEDWQWIDDAKTKWKFTPPEGQNAEEYRGGSVTPSAGLGSIAWWSKDFVLKQDDPLTARIDEQTVAAGYPDHWKLPYPNVYFTKEEQKRLDVLWNDIRTYVSQMEAKFIMGSESFDGWDKYVETLNKMGVPELVDIHQAAYERWNSVQ